MHARDSEQNVRRLCSTCVCGAKVDTSAVKILVVF